MVIIFLIQKNCHNCFEVSSCEDMRHSFSVKRSKDCADMIGHCRTSELLYNGVGVGAGSRKSDLLLVG